MDIAPFDESIPLSEEDLNGFEERQKLSLPDEYRQFLLLHNGGEPSEGLFTILRRDQQTREWIVRFFGLKGARQRLPLGYWADLEWWAPHRGVRMPAESLPIGSDPGGNLVCIAVEGPQRGAIYFWDHEEEAIIEDDEDPHPITDNLYYVAPNISDFLTMLGPLPEIP